MRKSQHPDGKTAPSGFFCAVQMHKQVLKNADIVL